MGNSPSNVNNDSDEEEGNLLQDITDLDGSIKDELDSTFDLGVLFNHKLLREATSKIKEEPASSILQQHHGHLLRWVEERRSRHEETITLSQFIDMLIDKGVEKDDAVELFNQFDAEGDGVLDRDTLQNALNTSGSAQGQKGELRVALKTLKACSICPGIIDAFVANKHSIPDHGKRLLKVILRNRASSMSIQTPVVEGFCNTTEMRLKVLHTHLQTIRDKAELKKIEPSCEAGEFLRPLTKCFSSTETSSNKADAFRLTNGDQSSYWQSDGPARSHWIRLRMRSNVVVKELSINVASADQSYMPQRVVVSGGRDEMNLRELNDVRIPSHITGSVVLLENVKMPYSVIQINIRRCHSDGCDTRIRGVNAVGYRVVKSKGVSVADATAVWYVSVLTATATMAMPVAPQLREMILNHTRTTLGHMVPLSLSLTSPVRPAYLSTSVLDEMEKFLHSLACHDDKLDSEGMQVLVEFSLVRGNLGGIFKVLKLLYDNMHLKLTAKNIVSSLVEEQEKAIQRHGGKLAVGFVGCDGGSKDDTSPPKNVLSENWTTEAYYSEIGMLSLSMAFNSERSTTVQLTKISLKACKGGVGPRCGLVFMHNEVQINDGKLDVSHLEKYNDWDSTKYQEYLKSTQRQQPAEDEPVAFFFLDNEWDEIDIHLDKPAVGKFIITKFIGTRDPKAERMGILGLQFYGYEKTFDEMQESETWKTLTSIPENEQVSGSTLFLQVLLFLDCMARDLKVCAKKKKDAEMTEKEARLDMTKISLKQIWDVYSAVIASEDENTVFASSLVLRLFHQALPFLKNDVHERVEGDTKELSGRVFEHLCEVVDDQSGKYHRKIFNIAKDIILDGTEVFFPDASTRRDHLLSMVDEVMEEKKLQSLALTFESLCKFFSNKDASGLLGLPSSLTKSGFDLQSVLSVMSTLVSVAYQECQSLLQSDFDPHEERKTSNLVQLLSAMQKSLLTWAKQQIDSENKEGRKIAVDIVVKYTELIAEKTSQALSGIGKCKTKDAAVTVMEQSFVAFTFRQMILFFNTFASVKELCLVILRHLNPVAMEIRTIAEDLPRYFMESNSSNDANGDRVILRTWEMESSHNYENNQNFTKVFSCPGCSEFLVQFDSRCETERRYDYLEFTDSNGVKKRFDQKVGSEKWPNEVVFHSGNKLNFLFHSDGSNNEWGYKFTVTARGCPDITLSWLFDLQLGMASLFGLFCSSVMAGYPKDAKKVKKKKDENDAGLLQSNIWTTLFRGGFKNNGKLQRSLSGHHETTHRVDQNVLSFAKGLATDETGKSYDLVKRCQKLCGLPCVGGAKVDEAIRCVFAALIWHSQRLRDELVLYATDCPPETIPAGISEAYKTAESLRMSLVEARQKLILEAEDGKQKNGKTIDPDEVVTSCKEKALFLLKFSGLTRIASLSDSKERSGPRSPSKKNAFHRISIHHRRQNKGSSGENAKSSDKYPSFSLIVDFVTNNNYSHTRVESLLEERKNFATNLHKVYMFASEYIRLFSRPDIFQAPVVIFLQQMLFHQKIFPSHYGDNLDGCGLELEGRVRKSYYTFLRRLLDSVRSFTRDPDEESASSKAFSCIRAYLLHFLDIEWKQYDLSFLSEINLPEFFLNTSKVTASALQQCSTELSDQRELEEYRENMLWKEQATKGFHEWWDSMQTNVKNPDEKRRLHLFLSRYAELFDVDVFCDGCKSPLTRSRYRCLNCFEIDLCTACYTGNVRPNGHTIEHEVVELRWKCDGCEGFIIGTRFNCNVCSDLDLCLGCFTASTWPARHTSSHSMKKFTKKTGLLVHQRIPAYTHTHAWFQFASLSLSLANALNDSGSSDFYEDYLYTTGILHGKCLALILKCLNEVLAVAKLTVKKEKEDAQQAALLKDAMVKSEGVATQPGTSEEGVVSKKSSEASSDISENKNAEHKSDSLVDKPEVNEGRVVDVSEKDRTPDSNVVETSTDAKRISEKSDDLKTDMTEPKSANSSETDVKTPSEPSKVLESSSTKEQAEGTSENENLLTKESSSDTSLESASSSTNIPKGPTTTPSESHSDTINPQESTSNRKLMMPQPEPVESKTSSSVSNVADNTDIMRVTSQPEPADRKESVIGLSVKNAKKESGDAVAMAISGEEKPGGVANESAKLTQEQLDSLFVKETQENLLGLIGAILPKDSKLSLWTSYNLSTEHFLISEFIPVLFKIARSPDVLFTHRNMTIGVLGKYLQCIPPELCDKGVRCDDTETETDKTEDVVENERRGERTVKSLFQFGAECLARSDLESASSVACCLQQLCQSSQWQPSITFEITQSLGVLTENSEHPKLENIFGILVFAGFPNVLQMGSRVEIKEQSSETKQGIALSYSTANASAVVADIKTRKRTSVKESNLQELSFLMELYCTSQFSTLLTIARDILHALKEQVDEVSVERMWVLYLVLKAMLSNLKGSKAKDLRNDIMDSSLVPSLVALACKGTELSRMWLLRDLEILSIKLYKKQLDGTKKVTAKLELVRSDSDNVDSSIQASSEPLRSLIQSFQEAIQAPMALLETILPRNDQARLLEEVHRSLWNEGTMRRLQNPPSSKAKDMPETPDDHSMDIGVVRYSPGELQPKTLKAKEEDEQRTSEKLMPSFTDEEIAENQRSLARQKSGNLLRAELEEDSPPELIKKVNKALCILYARHVLSRLLAEWPDDQELTSEVLDGGDEIQLIGILDLLQRIETKEAFEKVVTRVVNKGEAKLIKPLSLAAAHCMGEVKLSSETKETEHPYKNDVHKEDKVHIPGAATLTIKFDPRCSSEDSCDTLIMSTSQNYSEHRREFSGQSGWIDFEIPGDTLYFVFQSDSTNTDWGWKFTVTGGQLGRFETGYTILKALLVPDLDLARSLPLKKLWAWLVSVACSQTGEQRLMATGLLLRVLLVSSNLPTDERPDLNLLNSLWALYSDMLDKETGGLPPTLVPPSVRALTELFLVVENLAQEWGIAQDLIVGLTTDEALRRCFSQAVWNVGAIGIAIGMPNKATEALKKSLANASASEEKKKSAKTSTSKKPSPKSAVVPWQLASDTGVTNTGTDTSSESDMFSDDSSSSDS